MEDDTAIAQSVKNFFSKSGLAVDLAQTFNEASDKIVNDEYDIAVFDRMLPDGDGKDLIKIMRAEKSSAPVLILTAMNLNKDVIEGLNEGADDYLSKPFDLNVLLARVKSLLRRRNKAVISPILRIADLEINTARNEVYRGGVKIGLSPKEYAVLEYLGFHLNSVVDRMTLLEHVWNEDVDLFSNTVDVHIRYLRTKIDSAFKLKLIRTIKGKGYMLCGQ